MYSDQDLRALHAHVYPWCWPILWWALILLKRWQETHKCDVMIQVSRHGIIYMPLIGDTQSAERPFDFTRDMPDLGPVWDRVSMPQMCHPFETPGTRSGGSMSAQKATAAACLMTLTGSVWPQAPP